MGYNPAATFSKLSEMGVSFEPDSLAQRCHEARNRKLHAPKSKHVDLLPAIDYTKKSRPLLEIPQYYMKDVLNFIGYLSDTAKRQFKITFRNTLTGEGFVKWKPYIHRWTETYKKGILAKMYQLEASLGEDVQELEFISLTTFQHGTNREDCLTNLKRGCKKLLDLLRWKFGTQDYLWMFEPHESGFAHLHLVYFKKLTDQEKDSLKKLWAEKYEYGDYEHGLYFSAPRASENGCFVSGSIARIKGYLMKYLSKGLHSGSESFHEYVLNGKHVKLDMTLHELLFNSLLKKTKTRLWGCSRNFSKIMKRPDPELSAKDWECLRVEQLYVPYDESETQEGREEHFTSVVWDKKTGSYPSEEYEKWAAEERRRASFSCRPITWATEEEIKARKEYEAGLPEPNWVNIKKHRVG